MARRVARHRAQRAGWFGHGRTRALLSAGLLLGTGAVATSAYWTDQKVAQGVTVQSGTLHLDLESNQRVRPETISNWGDLSLASLADGTSRAAVMTVSNNSRGNARLSYRVQASAANALGAALRLTVRRGGTVSGGTCTGGTLIGTAGATLNGFNQAMDLTLTTGQSHDLCLQVTLPAGSNIASSASSTVTFTFPAKQEPS
ncbi:SipW-dependent-type signal peptide-containing protein [Nocardioides sp. QY071]|uniref:SipW-dependent-type signal peptide-containing protein n=1 Tax=Nocardioides sp. QY071 TaxID=3044187 RepID=UPI00249B8A83|nr:SipW-dependent-type signal peptide-containing protein [Nocardioides sp. QY071]WGY04351.1 SipW-dependent-type signal peptide-containing protein [Nocardioides sp. QY071]